MSILIKGMKMPKNCFDCNFTDDHAATCKLLNISVYFNVDKRAVDCPLVPVPPHGRLIDADAAYDCIAEEDHAGNYVDMDSVGRGIENTPTVIEAEEGE